MSFHPPVLLRPGFGSGSTCWLRLLPFPGTSESAGSLTLSDRLEIIFRSEGGPEWHVQLLWNLSSQMVFLIPVAWAIQNQVLRCLLMFASMYTCIFVILSWTQVAIVRRLPLMSVDSRRGLSEDVDMSPLCRHLSSVGSIPSLDAP